MNFQVEQFFGEGIPDDYRSAYDLNRGCLVIRWPEDSPEVRFDGGEPEDNSFYRDYSWVKRAIERAYEAGRARGRS